MDSKTILGFRENATSEMVSSRLLSSVSTSSNSDYSLPAKGDTLTKSFDKEMIKKCFVYCIASQWIIQLWNKQIYRQILQLIPMLKIDVSDIYYYVFINSRDISTKGISSADVIINDRQWSFKEDFLFGNCS